MNIFLQSNIPELLHFTPNQSFIDLKKLKKLKKLKATRRRRMNEMIKQTAEAAASEGCDVDVLFAVHIRN